MNKSAFESNYKYGDICRLSKLTPKIYTTLKFLAILFSFIFTIMHPTLSMAAQDCREQIKNVTCLADPYDHSDTDNIPRDAYQTHPCGSAPDRYVQKLLDIYDELPRKVQKVFCDIKLIQIVPDLGSTGMAPGYYGKYKFTELPDWAKQNFPSATPDDIFFRKEGHALLLDQHILFESRSSLQEWITRKEQTLMGRSMSDPPLDVFPKYSITSEGLDSDPLLFYVVVHEIGHFLDYANDVTKWQLKPECADRGHDQILPSNCFAATGLFASVSWEQGMLKRQNILKHEELLCYYASSTKCADNRRALSLTEWQEYLSSLSQLNEFFSPYSAVSSGEEFAESFVYSVVSEIWLEKAKKGVHFNFTIGLDFGPRGVTGDAKTSNSYMIDLNSAPLSYKYEFTRMFLNSNFATGYSNSIGFFPASPGK